MSMHSLNRRVERLFERLPSHRDFPDQEWPFIKIALVDGSAPYPEAAQAVAVAIAEIESTRPSWDRAHEMLYQAIEPYMDARIAVAEQLMIYEKQFSLAQAN